MCNDKIEIDTIQQAAQQGAAPDRLQLRSFLTALSAAGELGRSAVARGLIVPNSQTIHTMGEMGTLQSVLILILTPTFIVGVIAYLVKGVLQQLLARDIENHKQSLARDLEKHKTDLQIELEHSKMRMQNVLQVELFRYQTKFSRFHNKQADVVSEVYGMLFDAIQSMSSLVNPLQMSGEPSPEEKAKEAADKCNALIEFYNKHRIYLDEDICEKMDALLQKMRGAFIDYSFGRGNESAQREGLHLWHQAWKAMQEEVVPIEKALQQQFRRVLSADTFDAGDNIELNKTQIQQP